jgi:hypothetical protein
LSEQRPGNIESLENGTTLVGGLLDELLLKLLNELEVEQIFIGEGFLSDDGLHSLYVLTDGVVGVQLVGDGSMVLAGHTLANSGLHETRQRGQYVDRRVDLSVVDLTIDVDLSLSNITGQIGNRVGNIIVGHSKNRNLGDGTVAALNTTGALVNGSQIGIHITRETTTTRNFFSGSRDLTKSLSVGRHISQDNQDVLVAGVSQVLSSGQGKTRSNDTLNGRVRGQVQEQGDTLHRTVLLEIVLEEAGSFHVNTHSSENNVEVIFVVVLDGRVTLKLDETSLSANLGGNFVVGQTGGRENGNLLTTSNGIHAINGRDTSLDHLTWVDTRVWVDGLTLNIQEILSKNGGTLIDGLSGAVENTTSHILGNGKSHNVTSELDTGILGIDTKSTLENL